MADIDEPGLAANLTEAARGGTPQDRGPRERFAFAREAFTVTRPNSPQSESIAQLRNFIIGQHMRDGRRALAICAPLPETGCTFTSVNIAAALAQAGVNTLLIDANLRDAGIERLVTPVGREPAGLGDYLHSNGTVPPEVMGDVIANLSILFAGRRDDAHDYLATNVFKDLLDESVRSFDMTIVDCPPAAHYSDARRIATLLRHAMVIVRKNVSYARDVRTLIRELQHDRVNVVGTFLNDFA